MRTSDRIKSALMAISLCAVAVMACPSVRAQTITLDGPFYSSTRDLYQTMGTSSLMGQHTPTPDVSKQPNYVPDSRLTPSTNKSLAQGDYPAPSQGYEPPAAQPFFTGR